MRAACAPSMLSDMKLAPFFSVIAVVGVVGLAAWARPLGSGTPSPAQPSAVDEDAPAAPPAPAPTPSAAPSPWAAILPALQRLQPGAPQPAAPPPAAPQPAKPQPAAPQPGAIPPSPSPSQPFQLPAGLPALPAWPAGSALPFALPRSRPRRSDPHPTRGRRRGAASGS